MASTSKILVACKIRQHASLDRLRKFLESQKLIKCSHKARVPAHKARVPRAQSLGLPGTKLGLGRRTKRVPSGGAPGWLHCAPFADQEQAILWAGGCPRSIVGTCGTWVQSALRTIVSQPGGIVAYPPLAQFNTAH